jgi:hypothetical protein
MKDNKNDFYNGYGTIRVDGTTNSVFASQRMANKPIKQLFDSSYVRPDENPHVMQDDHP